MRGLFKIKKSRFILGFILGMVFLILNIFVIGEVTKGIVFFLLFIFAMAFNVDEEKWGGVRNL